METVKSTSNATKKPPMTPKAIIHQRFGDKAIYKVEEVQDLTQNGCPGLAVLQKGPCLYRCTLLLPEIVVVSDSFKRKKDAEQSAAEKAIEKLGIRQKEYKPTILEAWDDLTSRLAFLFANEFLSSLHPLSGHFRAALRREGHFNGCVPVSVIALYDAKIGNICKHVNPAAESNPLLVMSLVLKAAAKQNDMILPFEEQLSLKRRNPYPPDIIQPSTDHGSSLCYGSTIEVLQIPASLYKDVETLKLKIAETGYYLDVIGHELGVNEASNVLISRTIGKASSELRIYSPTPKRQLWDHFSERDVKQSIHLDESLNERASYISGQFVYGDAILASVGYTWKSADLFHEAVALRTYYRILVNKIPNGAYKISREAILAANLPLAFTTRSNWRGSLPRDILCTICRFHHLSEPVFSVQLISSVSSQDLPGCHKKLEVMEADRDEKSEAGLAASCGSGNLVGSTEASSCEVKIYSKKQELILRCSPQEAYRKQTDAIQSASLKVLSWLDIFLEKPDTPVEKLNAVAEKLDIHFSLHYLSKEFASCHSVHKCGITIAQALKRLNYSCSGNVVKDEPAFVAIAGQSSGITPSNGSLASVCYSVSLVTDGDRVKEHLESCEEFEFEVGNEAVLPDLEVAVAQMTVGQSSNVQTELVPCELILAAAEDSAATLSLLSSRSCKLEYNITLLRVTEPLEERMEQALFSPPLSKQRVEFAVRHIKEFSASSLVDFGCGSGSLLDSLLLYPTSLEKIVGVDISQRSLARAAKSLHTKLNSFLGAKDTSSGIKSAVLYDGSITKYDSRLHGFDIATCLEVIEHMEEKDACLFGDVVLSSFCPKFLIVSTPNYEYNVILQGSTPQSQEENPDEKNQSQSCKFRNHDHKFEWTRSQFNHWASDLAARHNYSVAFSGVGGSADTEPGFASQIAIFRRSDDDYDRVAKMEFGHQYVVLWEWNIEDLLPKKE
ncbi:small RNA 2'-O-methyltransferase-like isoform X1 [Primulina huaijiensis]|uniref:small RNA 2'-O-methyltransferase-like isoform X1 n=1 Tax=Primulina huaijiensis TaxID=1492673 RepID=UPI003CC78B65